MEDQEFNIKNYFNFCKRKRKLLLIILLSSIVVILTCLNIYNIFSTKLYKSESKIRIEGKASSDAVISNYSDIIKSEAFLKKVLSEKELNYDAINVAKYITLESSTGSTTYTLSVSLADANNSQALNKAIITNFAHNINGQIVGEEEIIEGKTRVYISQAPTLSEKAENINYLTSNLNGLLFGIIFFLVVTFIIWIKDDTINSINEINSYKCNCLGLKRDSNCNSEELKIIRTYIEFSGKKSIMVTPSCENDEKICKEVSHKLSESFEIDNKKVILIDTDIRKSSNNEGYIDFIDDFKNRLDLKKYCTKSSNKNFSVMRSGRVEDATDAVEMLNSKKNEKAISYIKPKFDYTVFNTISLKQYADALIMTKFADYIIIVVNEGVTKKEEIEHTISSLKSINKNIDLIIYLK